MICETDALSAPRLSSDVKRLENVVDLSETWDFKTGRHVDDAEPQRAAPEDLEKRKSFFEMMVREGLGILDDLKEGDNLFREMIFADQSALSADEIASQESAVVGTFQTWLRVARRLEGGMSAAEQMVGQISNASELRSAIQDVERILTPDAKFFSEESLTRLRDAAIASYRGGRGDQLRA